MILDITDIPIHNKRDRPFIKLMKYGKIELTKQKTGFGEKIFFICPGCKARRQKLIVDGERINGCRSCADYNLYATRQNLYVKGDFYIIWKMYTVAWKKGLDINIPFHVEDYLFKKPNGVSNSDFEFLLKQLYMLKLIREERIYFHARPDVKTINFLISRPVISALEDIDELKAYCTMVCSEFRKPTKAESEILLLIGRR